MGDSILFLSKWIIAKIILQNNSTIVIFLLSTSATWGCYFTITALLLVISHPNAYANHSNISLMIPYYPIARYARSDTESYCRLFVGSPHQCLSIGNMFHKQQLLFGAPNEFLMAFETLLQYELLFVRVTINNKKDTMYLKYINSPVQCDSWYL